MRLSIKVGLRNVPKSIEPIRTLNKVTIIASLKPNHTKVIRVAIFDIPSFIQGEGRGIICSKVCRTTLMATKREMYTIFLVS